MTEDRIDLTRRKLLAGLGTVGAAGATAGLGTSAYFKDVEPFEGNTLTAGELDLTVDWEEHYWNEFAVDATVQHVDDADDVGEGQVGLPDPRDPMIAVDDLETFMDATAIEAFPDRDGDGVQDALEEYDACSQFAQLPEGLDPAAGLRSENDDTTTEEGYAPLVDLTDVKPGDFGELTLSFHLCDNPGYVWLQGALADASENDHTEPEAEVDDDPEVELLDEVRTMLWYDEDGDNVFEPGADEEPVDLVVVFDQSESMNSGPESGNNDANPGKLDAAVSGAKSLVDTVGGKTNVGLVCFSYSNATGVKRGLGSPGADIKLDLDQLNGPDTPGNSLIDDNNWSAKSEGSDGYVDSDGDGQDDDNLILDTDLQGGIEAAHDELTGSNARSGARKIMVVLSDGKPWPRDQDVTGAASDAKADDVEIFTIAYGSGADEGLMASVASSPTDSHAFSGGEADVGKIFGQIGRIVGGEEAFFEGTLRELLAAVSTGDGIPLDGNRDTLFDETGDPDDHADREEFVDSTNNFVGLAWWVPRSVGNSIQGDSVSFDLGFYVEQSRHNDGSGPTTPAT